MEYRFVKKIFKIQTVHPHIHIGLPVTMNREQPYDCAGSFKCEGLAVALFSRLCGDDPTALEGLPLISLVNMLGIADINPLI